MKTPEQIANYDVKMVYESVEFQGRNLLSLSEKLADYRLDQAVDGMMKAKFWLGRYVKGVVDAEQECRDGEQLPGGTKAGDPPATGVD